MMTLTFTKMHGLGNDFVMLDSRNLPPLQDVDISRLTQILCDRHFGVGADGLIIAAPPADPNEFDLKFIYYNGDGEEAEMCGNGIRCFTRFVHDIGMTSKKTLTVETLAGPIRPTLNDDESVTVDMGKPILNPADVPFNPGQDGMPASIEVDGLSIPVWAISMGNPHAIIFQEDLPAPLDPAVFGPKIEKHPAFPAKTNVEFVTQKAAHAVDVVVWERGCGFTLACGTGACATAVATALSQKTGATVDVHLPGGPLHIVWDKESSGHIFMTGPATTVFQGSIVVDIPKVPSGTPVA